MKGKTILITGGAGGIGYATAKLFAHAGASVIITDIKSPKEHDDNIFFIEADASVEDEVKRVVKEVKNKYSKIDFLFNNCGIWSADDSRLEFNEKEFDQIIKVNFKSAVWFVKYSTPLMLKKDTSCIITSSSIWAMGKLHGALPYAVSKACLILAPQNWAEQFAPIRSVSIVLGAIDTPMLRANPNGTKEASRETLLKRAGTPEEVAETVLYLANCRYVNAMELCLDGGSFNR